MEKSHSTVITFFRRLAERLQAWKWIHPSKNRSLMEIAVDKGRPIVLRFRDGSKMIIQDGHDEVRF